MRQPLFLALVVFSTLFLFALYGFGFLVLRLLPKVEKATEQDPGPEDEHLIEPLRRKDPLLDKIIPRNLQEYFKIAREFVPLLPEPEDGLIGLATKAVAALSHLDQLHAGKGGDPWSFCVPWLHANKVHNKIGAIDRIVYELLEESPIADQFDRNQLTIYDESRPNYLLEYTHRDTGKRVWISMHGVEPKNVWFDNEFGFDQLVATLWTPFENGIHIDLETKTQSFSGKQSKQMFPLALTNTPIFGEGGLTVDRWVHRLRKCRENLTPRSYLLVGPPGTGKSTAAAAVCRALGLRLLRVAPSGHQTTFLRWLVSNLQPDVILLDDYDRTLPKNRDLSDTLSWLSDVRSSGVIVIMTANDISTAPPALLRPGRVDEILWFGAPCAEARYRVLMGYVELWTLLSDKTPEEKEKEIQTLVKATEGDTEATLRYLAEELRHSTVQDILAILQIRKQVMAGVRFRKASPREDKEENQQEVQFEEEEGDYAPVVVEVRSTRCYTSDGSTSNSPAAVPERGNGLTVPTTNHLRKISPSESY